MKKKTKMSENKGKKYSVVLKVEPHGIALLEEKTKVLMSGLPLVAANAVAEEKFKRYRDHNWSMSCDEGKYKFWNWCNAGCGMMIETEVRVLEEDENGKVDIAAEEDDDIPF